jgi:leader peptidase (prepilin peptidase)/N-methyltransferase
MPMFFFICIGLLSLSVGSFLNVVVYRLPKMLEREWYGECREFLSEEISDTPVNPLPKITLSKPDSTCPKCNHKIRFYENIPVLSWLVLRGKCSQCHNAISTRYPLVELFTGVLGVVIAGIYGVSTFTIFMLILTWGLIALTLIDLDHMLLPDQIVLPLLWLGLLFNLNAGFVSLNEAVIGAVVGYMSLYGICWLFKLLTGKEGMGHGDFKLFALFGAWIGWQLLPLLILMASSLGATVGISLMLFKGHKREQAIPFGPYLALAGWVTIVWGEGIWAWYLSAIL